MSSIDRETANRLIDGHPVPYRSCCGTTVDSHHIPECVNFVAVTRPERCFECDMIGFHRPACSSRTATAENPKHYEHPSGVEAIQVNRCMTFTAGSAFKYILRYESKSNPPEDLRKARWYTADVNEFGDPIFISMVYYAQAAPLLLKMIEHETNEYRLRFFHAVLDLDIPAMASAVEDARESIA